MRNRSFKPKQNSRVSHKTVRRAMPDQASNQDKHQTHNHKFHKLRRRDRRIPPNQQSQEQTYQDLRVKPQEEQINEIEQYEERFRIKEKQ